MHARRWPDVAPVACPTAVEKIFGPPVRPLDHFFPLP
jgi:hypothetical protein